MPRKRLRQELLTAKQVAASLGVTRQTFYNHLKRLDIQPSGTVSKRYHCWTMAEVEALRKLLNKSKLEALA